LPVAASGTAMAGSPVATGFHRGQPTILGIGPGEQQRAQFPQVWLDRIEIRWVMTISSPFK
jgi:hypothetical protein